LKSRAVPSMPAGCRGLAPLHRQLLGWQTLSYLSRPFVHSVLNTVGDEAGNIFFLTMTDACRKQVISDRLIAVSEVSGGPFTTSNERNDVGRREKCVRIYLLLKDNTLSADGSHLRDVATANRQSSETCFQSLNTACFQRKSFRGSASAMSRTCPFWISRSSRH